MRVRYRVNTAISTKGVITWDCTAEVEQDMDIARLIATGENVQGEAAKLMEFQLALSDSLVAEMRRRYPIEGEAVPQGGE
ncbi:hypothetical protein LCGC14_1788930 [marine sediment metagenome]|uniref:Uncharacterized protein n=1 Tax=marine sediment metagenome TaxID=412755 RepID=A0A0F9HFP8_9ZZZZ